MCKFCDLELNKQYASLRESDFRTWPEEIKDYSKWMSEVWDEGWEWRIDDNGNVFLIMFNEGGYNSTVLDCKFCPNCGRKLKESSLSFKEAAEIVKEKYKNAFKYLKDN